MQGLKFNGPTAATAILSLVFGVLAVINQAVLSIPTHWHAAITTILVFAAALGISPLTGASFRTALHLSNGVATVLAVLFAVVAIILTYIPADTLTHSVFAAIITVAAGLGFAPAILTAAGNAVAPAQPAAQTPTAGP